MSVEAKLNRLSAALSVLGLEPSKRRIREGRIELSGALAGRDCALHVRISGYRIVVTVRARVPVGIRVRRRTGAASRTRHPRYGFTLSHNKAPFSFSIENLIKRIRRGRNRDCGGGEDGEGKGIQERE